VPLDDLFRALPAAILVGVLPGLALASAVVPRWRWWEWLAAAPGLSVGIIGVIGLLYHDLHIGFTPFSVTPVLIAMDVIAIVLRVRTASRRSVPASDSAARWQTAVVVGSALIAGAVAAGTMTASYRSMPLPPATDAPVHAFVAEATARQHDVLPVEHIPVDGTGSVRARPGFEAAATVMSWLGGPRPTSDMLPLALIALTLIPLSLALLALETTDHWLIAAVAPLLAIGMPFPRFPLVFGEYPLLLDSTLVVPLIIAGKRSLEGRDVASHAAFVGIAVGAIWAVHGLEIITAIVVGLPLCVLVILQRRRQAMTGLVAITAAAVVAALVVTAITRLPAVPAAAVTAVETPSEAGSFLGILGSSRDSAEVFNVFRNSVLVTSLALPLYVMGVGFALIRHRLRWAILVNLFFIACLADVGYGHALGSLWNRVFPWAVVDRLLGMQYWVVPLIMAFGFVCAGELLLPRAGAAARAALATSRSSRRAPSMLAGAVLATVVVVTIVSGTNNDHGVYDQAVDVHGLASDADVAAIAQMDDRLTPGSIVLTNTSGDAGIWINALSRDVEYSPVAFVRNIVDSRGQLVSVDPRTYALSQACASPAPAAASLGGADAVFVGSKQRIAEQLPRWDAQCIAGVPGLRELLQVRSGSLVASVYAVTTPR
jgi:hypothetical protein